MKLVYWEYKGVKVPMVEDAQEGKLYCTGKVICKGLGLKEQDLKDMCHRYPEHFQDSFKVANSNLKDFIGTHREEFGIQRVRKIYSDAELIAFAILSKSPVSIEFMQDYIRFVREQVKVGFVSQAQHEVLLKEFECQQRRLELVEKHVERMASEDGRRLNEYKEVKKPHLAVVPKEG